MNHHVISSIALGLAFLISLPAFAQTSDTPAPTDATESFARVIERYTSGTITSTEVADVALEDVKRQRAEVNARFAEDEAICYKKFFVTSCMDAAKDRRRAALKQLSAIEVEANAYNRRARVEQKDQALRERQAKQEAKAAERQDNQTPGKGSAAPASPQDIADLENRSRQMTDVPAAAPAKNYNTERAAQHKEELTQDRAKEIAEAKKREENIKAYERKQQRSLERQREIAARKEEKDRERAAKGK
jgi:colicin import membrane protein